MKGLRGTRRSSYRPRQNCGFSSIPFAWALRPGRVPKDPFPFRAPRRGEREKARPRLRAPTHLPAHHNLLPLVLLSFSYPTPRARIRPAGPRHRKPQASSFTPGGVLREKDVRATEKD